MLDKLSIRAKLTILFGVSLLGILALSIGGNLVLIQNTESARTVKEKKFSRLIIMDKIAVSVPVFIRKAESAMSAGVPESALADAEDEKSRLLTYLSAVRELSR